MIFSRGSFILKRRAVASTTSRSRLSKVAISKPVESPISVRKLSAALTVETSDTLNPCWRRMVDVNRRSNGSAATTKADSTSSELITREIMTPK